MSMFLSLVLSRSSCDRMISERESGVLVAIFQPAKTEVDGGKRQTSEHRFVLTARPKSVNTLTSNSVHYGG
jgi:hypothetical protein